MLLQGEDHWQPSNPVRKSASIRLYKLHGSLHFQIKEKAVKGKDEAHVLLKERPYTKQHGTLKFTIIPPEWNEQYDRGVFARVWRLTSAALRRAKDLVFVGYTLPNTNLHSTVLFQTRARKEGLKSLVVVNPDPEARRMTRDVVQRGISKNTRVLRFASFSDFAATDRDIWAT